MVPHGLHTQWSTFPLIFRLPTEILETIFVHCARDYQRTTAIFHFASVPHWVNVSYVCHHWRDVALNCPTLWSYLFVVSSRWTEELLARSKRAPLKLHVEQKFADNHRASNFMNQVMDHAERIQELRLCLLPVRSDWEFFSKLSSSTPRLRHLNIFVLNQPSKWSSVLFDGDTPALRTLQLSRCSVPWFLFKLSGLTTLTLCHVPVWIQQNMEEFLSTLSGIHGLTHLHLDDALPSSVGFLSSRVFHNFQKIKLPHLSRVLIVAPLSTVIALLSCLNIQSTTEVRLQCDLESEPFVDGYAMLHPVLAQRFRISTDQALSNPTIRSLVVMYSKAKFTLSTSERDFEEWDRNIPLQITIHFGPLMEDDERNRIANDICRAIPLSTVQNLHVIYPPTSVVFWTHTFGHLHDLRYIKLSRGSVQSLVPLLFRSDPSAHENLGGCDNRGLNQTFAPALEELKLHDIEFSDGTDDAQSLYDALSSRKEPRGRLTMTRCYFIGERVTKLNMIGQWGGGFFRVLEKRESL